MPSPRSPWWRHGFFNTLEHGLSRTADALSTLILLWILQPEIFSVLALAQAAVAPILFFFFAPEAILYREFSNWKSAGELPRALRAFRLFSYTKGLAAILISLLVAAFHPSQTSFEIRFYSMIWAFALALAPQIVGPDREYLRISLRLRTLNLLTIFQKVTFLGGTAIASLYFPGRIDALAILVSGMLLLFTISVRLTVSKIDEPDRPGRPAITILWNSFTGFSIWQHLSGVIWGWVQMLHILVLGFLVVYFTDREIGLYSTAFKLAGFTLTLPLALSNLFAIWVGRRSAVENPRMEKKQLLQMSILLSLTGLAVAIAVYLLSPWIFSLLSHGKWLPDEQSRMSGWMGGFLLLYAVLGSSLTLGSWLTARASVKKIFFECSLPWLALSGIIFWFSARYFGIGVLCYSTVLVGLIHFGLLLRLYFKETQ